MFDIQIILLIIKIQTKMNRTSGSSRHFWLLLFAALIHRRGIITLTKSISKWNAHTKSTQYVHSVCVWMGSRAPSIPKPCWSYRIVTASSRKTEKQYWGTGRFFSQHPLHPIIHTMHNAHVVFWSHPLPPPSLPPPLQRHWLYICAYTVYITTHWGNSIQNSLWLSLQNGAPTPLAHNSSS